MVVVKFEHLPFVNLAWHNLKLHYGCSIIMMSLRTLNFIISCKTTVALDAELAHNTIIIVGEPGCLTPNSLRLGGV